MSEINEAKKLLNDEELLDHLLMLKYRWDDEKEYEDFADYETSIKNAISKYDVKFLQATKRPFGFKIIDNYIELHFSLKFMGDSVKFSGRIIKDHK